MCPSRCFAVRAPKVRFIPVQGEALGSDTQMSEKGLKARTIPGSNGTGLQPFNRFSDAYTQGFALGWYRTRLWRSCDL